MNQHLTNKEVIDLCDGTTDEDVSVFVPVKTLRRLVKESSNSKPLVTVEVLERALDSIELLQQIRCHPRRHDLERDWLTRADEVIGYWEEIKTANMLRAAIRFAEEAKQEVPVWK